MAVMKITRRQLLLGTGGAVAVAGASGLWLGVQRLGDRRFRHAVARGDAFAPNVFLAIEPTGDVVIWLTRAEMGQGVATALPLIIAEELDADWDRVRVEQAIAEDAYDYGRMLTVASASVRSQWTELRRAGAAARQMLLAAAARRWGVPARQCSSESGYVVHGGSGQRLTYGELAAEARASRMPLRPRLKSPSEFRLVGTNVARVDVPGKVDGSAQYGVDVRLEGMKVAVLARSPTLRGRPASYDASAARAVTGVVDVIEVPMGIAVIADHTWAALQGHRALSIEWRDDNRHPLSSSDISALMYARLDDSDAGVARDDGDVRDMLRQSSRRVKAEFEVPYLAHAPMEPMNCTAWIHDDLCEVWAPTQAPDDARAVAAHHSRLPLTKVRVHTTLLGGGFGRRATSDFVAEAVELAKRTGYPIQVLWRREDDMQQGPFRDAAVQRLTAALDDEGLPNAWYHRVVSVSADASEPGRVNPSALMGADDQPYRVGPMRIEWAGVQAPVRTMIWRSVGHSYTAFAIERFVDQLARTAGNDPLHYRIRMLGNEPRLARCIERVGEMSGWSEAVEQGRWLGLAAVKCFGSYCAQVAELTAQRDGRLRVSKVWCAADCGVLVHPDTVRGQIEGGIIFGLTAALHGRMTVRDGRIIEDNFDSYPLLRIDNSPEIEIALIQSAEAPGGVGELSVPPIAPAVANALYAARGVTVGALPMELGRID
jgi:isoquinoline 1-oxidoreductase subunit beta